jgi:hypothetical protein
MPNTAEGDDLLVRLLPLLALAALTLIGAGVLLLCRIATAAASVEQNEEAA